MDFVSLGYSNIKVLTCVYTGNRWFISFKIWITVWINNNLWWKVGLIVVRVLVTDANSSQSFLIKIEDENVFL